MGRVRAFDGQLRQLYYDQFVACKLLVVLLGGCAAMLMFIPIPLDVSDLEYVHFIPAMLYGMAVLCYLWPYMVINEKGKSVSIYQTLRYMPVSKSQIRNVRLEYLAKFCIPMTVFNIVAAQLGAALSHEWWIGQILYPLAISAFVWISGILDVHWIGIGRNGYFGGTRRR